MDQPSRILILSASAAAGHLRAAQAIEQALCAKSTCDVRHIDALDHTTKVFRRLYQKAYIDLVNRARTDGRGRPVGGQARRPDDLRGARTGAGALNTTRSKPRSGEWNRASG